MSRNLPDPRIRTIEDVIRFDKYRLEVIKNPDLRAPVLVHMATQQAKLAQIAG